MSMVVRHNAAGLMASNVLENTTTAFKRAVQKLSTGLRVNASDLQDAAGLGISERMRAQVRGFDRAVSNGQDGLSMIQTAEGALTETDSLLQRLRELAVQATSDSLTQQDRGYIQAEIDQTREEITRIGDTTQFNKKKLLNGDAAALWSSSDSETVAIIHGGLIQTDAFGEKTQQEANYRIFLTADAGQGEVLKSSIFQVKNEDGNLVTATGGAELRDVAQFYDSDGRFLLDDPQTISILQEDGQRANVTLYADDTLDTVAAKFNNAIANGLKQNAIVNDAGHFASFVSTPGEGQESVEGTLLVRSVVAGAAGELSFAGDEGVLNAFGFNTIQASRENAYTAHVTNAHTGAVVAGGVKLTGNKLIGVVNPNVDVEFSASAGVTALWDATRGTYIHESGTYETTLHLKDRTTLLQTGISQGDDISINIGDMRAHALGLDAVRVSNREASAHSISIIDNAIDRVSSQRAKLGAALNRMEHTIGNLQVAGENINNAESRIRDADSAKEMVNLTKAQILLHAGTSMVAQANQLPQQVMTLLR